MASSHAFALALALALAFAGCINGDPIPAPAPAPAPAPGTTNATTESVAIPSNATTPAATVANDTRTTNATPAAPTIVPYAWESKLPAQACRPDPVTSGCAAALPSEAGSDSPALAGNVTQARLELTWTPAAPGGVAEMRFALVRADVVLAEATGPSPLALALDVPPGEGALTVHVSAASMTPGPVVGYAHAEQPFAVDGTFVVA